MIECRYCRAYFSTAPEAIGSRCPECHMPLFERQERPSRDVDSSVCAYHAEAPSLGSCPRCKKPVCLVCKTRWHEEILCPECVRLSMERGELHPREIKIERNRTLRSFFLALGGWILFVVALVILLGHTGPPPIRWSIALLFIALFPAFFALGFAVTQVLQRSGEIRLALSTMVMSASQLGLTIGLVLVNFLRN